MNRKVFSFFLPLICCIPFCSSGQMIDSMMKVYADHFPQEKLYMQFDKKAYNPGDRIWYKAYLFTGFDPSPFSKNFYTELYDVAGNLIIRNTAPLGESVAIGSFDLPSNFEGTRIRIRAYTSWMLNFDSSFIYTKDLRIIGSTQDSSAHGDPPATSVHFFPEGGDMIAGVDNTIAFLAEDAFGQPKKISGNILDQSGKAVLSFSSNAQGLGKFLLNPDKQDVFYAMWKDEKGAEHRTELPAVKNSGIALRLINSPGKLLFSVSRPQTSTGNQQVVVIGHMNQQMVYKATVNLKEVNMSGGNIPTAELPTGILQITVFDLTQSPLAERVCFINNHNYNFDGEVKVVSKSLKRRGRNEVQITVNAADKTNMSLSITDAEVDGNRPYDDNIITRLLLTGDLRGYIKFPNYYFQNNSDSLAQQLDLLMLTHGWRRFKWDDLSRGKVPVVRYPIENYLSLNAEVLGIQPSRIVKDESLNVIFQYKDSATNMLTVPYKGNGKFQTSGLIFYDTAKAFYMFNTNRNLSNEAAVIFKNGLYPGVRKLKAFDMSLAQWSPDDTSLIRKSRDVFQEVAQARAERNKVQNLQVVTVLRKVKSDREKLDELYSSGLFSGGNATIFDLMNDPFAVASLDIFTYLQGKVAGLTIVSGGPTPTLTWRGSQPSIYLNEMQVTPDAVKNISVADIAMIKVFSPGSATASGNSGGGVIAIYQKKGHDRKPDPSIKGLDMSKIPGYTATREFYSPDYLINPEPENDDIRTTLYWNPEVLGSKGNNKFNFTFYNSDVTHRIRLILEGYSDEGKLIHLEKLIE